MRRIRTSEDWRVSGKIGVLRVERPTRTQSVKMPFADISKFVENGQLKIFVRLLVDDLIKNCYLLILAWSLHKSKRPSKRTPAPEILATSQGIDLCKKTTQVHSKF